MPRCQPLQFDLRAAVWKGWPVRGCDASSQPGPGIKRLKVPGVGGVVATPQTLASVKSGAGVWKFPQGTT